jgi:hypothetical protein
MSPDSQRVVRCSSFACRLGKVGEWIVVRLVQRVVYNTVQRNDVVAAEMPVWLTSESIIYIERERRENVV